MKGFGGFDCNYRDSKVVILPVPYEGTASYMRGTMDGPKAIIEASQFMQWFDEELKSEPHKVGIHTLPELELEPTPEDRVDAVKKRTISLVRDGKFMVMLGGEHAITIGAVEALRESYPALSVLQIDAHADLLDSYDGTRYSHADVMARAVELCDRNVSVGVRSISKEENEKIEELSKEKRLAVFWAKDILNDKDAEWMEKAISALDDDVYLTIDLDAFDPGLMPGVGTPEPGGLHWWFVLRFLKKVFETRNVVGCDVVELMPIKGQSVSEFTAAKLVYKLIGYLR